MKNHWDFFVSISLNWQNSADDGGAQKWLVYWSSVILREPIYSNKVYSKQLHLSNKFLLVWEWLCCVFVQSRKKSYCQHLSSSYCKFLRDLWKKPFYDIFHPPALFKMRHVFHQPSTDDSKVCKFKNFGCKFMQKIGMFQMQALALVAINSVEIWRHQTCHVSCFKVGKRNLFSVNKLRLFKSRCNRNRRCRAIEEMHAKSESFEYQTSVHLWQRSVET